MYSIMWSEHCSYKSSKVHLRQFTEKAPPSQRMLAGIGANAGVIKVSDKLAVTFKVESHNHPSFVEPHQGAATGVGGIVRDILAMGARPIAVMDPLRFGAPDHEDTKRVLPGVVGGIGGYGNCLGLPNIGGEVVFDSCYQGNPLVNALCVGVLPVDRLQNKAATGPGNVVVLIGAKTGRDGIGGVSVLASSTFGAGSEQRRPSVQVGDPFLEKLLIEACLEIYDLNLVVGIQDLGGAGLTCALSETAAAAGTGMAINLDLVPLREASMRPEEILASESQERMLLVVTPENLPVVLSLCARWGVLATAIGEVTAPEPEIGGRLRIWWRGEVIVDVPPGSLADDGPIYARPMREPFDRELMKVDRAETLRRPETSDELRATLLQHGGFPEPVRQELGDRAVRPVRAGQHRARAAGGRRCDPDRRDLRPRRRAGRGRQRPLRQARPVRRCPPGPGRGVPQCRGHRRRAGGRDQLPQLRFPRGRRSDVAVRRGGARARRRLPGTRHPGDRRQCELLQPDRRDSDPPDPDRRRTGIAHQRGPAGADGLLERRRRHLPIRTDARGTLRLRVGARDPQPPRRCAAGGGPGWPNSGSAAYWPRRLRTVI